MKNTTYYLENIRNGIIAVLPQEKQDLFKVILKEAVEKYISDNTKTGIRDLNSTEIEYKISIYFEGQGLEFRNNIFNKVNK